MYLCNIPYDTSRLFRSGPSIFRRVVFGMACVGIVGLLTGCSNTPLRADLSVTTGPPMQAESEVSEVSQVDIVTLRRPTVEWRAGARLDIQVRNRSENAVNYGPYGRIEERVGGNWQIVYAVVTGTPNTSPTAYAQPTPLASEVAVGLMVAPAEGEGPVEALLLPVTLPPGRYRLARDIIPEGVVNTATIYSSSVIVN